MPPPSSLPRPAPQHGEASALNSGLEGGCSQGAGSAWPLGTWAPLLGGGWVLPCLPVSPGLCWVAGAGAGCRVGMSFWGRPCCCPSPPLLL